MNKTLTFFISLLFCLSLPFSHVAFAEDTYGPVKRNDFLSKIVKKGYPDSNLTRDQLMIGILRANYDSFRGGNVHFLKVGETLTLPGEDVVKLIDADEATKTVEKHLQFFRQGRTGDFPATPLPAVESLAPAEEASVEEAKDSVAETQAESSTSTEIDSNNEVKKAEEELEPLVKEVEEASKETEEKRNQLESMEEQNEQQNNVLQSLEMQIQRLEQELETGNADAGGVPNAEAAEEENTATVESAESTEESLEKATAEAMQSDALPAESESPSVEATTLPEAEGADATSIESLPQSSSESATQDASATSGSAEAASQEQSASTAEPSADSTTSTSFFDKFNLPWWVWAIPLVILPLLLFFLFGRKKGEQTVSQQDFATSTGYYEDDTSSTPSSVKMDVDATSPVIKTSNTVVESEDFVKEPAENDAVTKDQPDATSHQTLADSASEQEISLKIDMARAYLDMDYHDAAVEILNEVVKEGNAVQVERAREILARI